MASQLASSLLFSEDALAVDSTILIRDSATDLNLSKTNAISNSNRRDKKHSSVAANNSAGLDLAYNVGLLAKTVNISIISLEADFSWHSFVVGRFHGTRLTSNDNVDKSIGNTARPSSLPLMFLQVLLRIDVRVKGNSLRSSSTSDAAPDAVPSPWSVFVKMPSYFAPIFVPFAHLELYLYPISSIQKNLGSSDLLLRSVVPLYAIPECKLLKLRPYIHNYLGRNSAYRKLFSLSEIRDSLIGQVIYSFERYGVEAGIACTDAASGAVGSQAAIGDLSTRCIPCAGGALYSYSGALAASSPGNSHVLLSIVSRKTQVIVADCICLGNSFCFLRNILDRLRGKPTFYNRFNSDSISMYESMNILDNHVKFEEIDIDLGTAGTFSGIDGRGISNENVKSFIIKQLINIFDKDIYSLIYGILSKNIRSSRSSSHQGGTTKGFGGDTRQACLLLVGSSATNMIDLISFTSKTLLVRINAATFLRHHSRKLHAESSEYDTMAAENGIIDLLSDSIDNAIRLQAVLSSSNVREKIVLVWNDIDDMLSDPSREENESSAYYKRKLIQKVGSMIKSLSSSGHSIGIIATANFRKIGGKYEYLKDLFTQCIEIPKLTPNSCISMIKSVTAIYSLCLNSGEQHNAFIDILKDMLTSKFMAGDLDMNQVCTFIASGYADLIQTRLETMSVSGSGSGSGSAPDKIESTKLEEIKIKSDQHDSPNRDIWGSGIVGLAEVKKQLEEAIFWPKLYSHLFRALKCPAPVGILLYGPPGTGKTLLPRALSLQTILKVSFYSIKLSDVVKGYIGEGERLLHATFAMAKATSPSILFIDEFQAIFSDRDAHDRDAVGGTLTSTLLSCLDGVALWNDAAATVNNSFVTIIASTNTPWAIDKAFVRSGRMDRQVLVGTLDPADRLAFLDRILEDLILLKSNIDVSYSSSSVSSSSSSNHSGRFKYSSSALSLVEEIVEATDSFTGADFSKLRRNLRISFTKNPDIICSYSNDENIQLEFLNMIKATIKINSRNSGEKYARSGVNINSSNNKPILPPFIAPFTQQINIPSKLLLQPDKSDCNKTGSSPLTAQAPTQAPPFAPKVGGWSPGASFHSGQPTAFSASSVKPSLFFSPSVVANLGDEKKESKERATD